MKHFYRSLIMRLALLTVLFVIGGSCVRAQSQTARIYILRPPVMGVLQGISAFTQLEISINDLMIGALPNKKYIECVVPVGNVVITMNSALAGNNQAKMSLQVLGGEDYYVTAGISVIGESSQNPLGLSLYRMSDTEGAKLLKKCKKALVADVSEYGSYNTSVDTQQSGDTVPTVVSTSVAAQPQALKQKNKITLNSDVDKNIPVSKHENTNTFALIIANENYMFVDDVEYALNDGNAFKEYCIKTLGIPERQIWFYENASLGLISNGVNKMLQAMNIFDGANAIVYYCGHGIPDEKTAEAYIVPVDGNGTDTSSCYSLNKLYKTLADAKAGNITYFMDACFTGANRDGSMLVAARGVAREAKKEVINGNTIVFSAASGDETAMPFREKRHGLFTYFLLKKLQETKGDVSYGELAEYIRENVKREAFLTNEKPQSPVVATSEGLSSTWQKVKMK